MMRNTRTAGNDRAGGFRARIERRSLTGRRYFLTGAAPASGVATARCWAGSGVGGQFQGEVEAVERGGGEGAGSGGEVGGGEGEVPGAEGAVLAGEGYADHPVA